LEKSNINGVVRARELIQLENNIILVCEYFEGRSLRDILKETCNHDQTLTKLLSDTSLNNKLLDDNDKLSTSISSPVKSTPFTLQTFLPLAIQLSLTLGQIHQQNIIHKDLSCGNILYNESNGTCMIIDFGLASVLSSENKKNNILTGTIGYISPEQTGRSNKKLDYRTDLYSLGTHTYI
jgi:serine/threonine protein kinase